MDKKYEDIEITEASIEDSDEDVQREHKEGVPVVLYEGIEV